MPCSFVSSRGIEMMTSRANRRLDAELALEVHQREPQKTADFALDRAGVDGLEIDVALMPDGAAIAFHQGHAEVDRDTGRRGRNDRSHAVGKGAPGGLESLACVVTAGRPIVKEREVLTPQFQQLSIALSGRKRGCGGDGREHRAGRRQGRHSGQGCAAGRHGLRHGHALPSPSMDRKQSAAALRTAIMSSQGVPPPL